MEVRRKLGVCLFVILGVFADRVSSEILSADLHTTRSIMERDWLQMKLEVMGLRLSFPAYRIELELTEDNVIFFTFLSSGGMAEHMSEAGRLETSNALTYHAEGIRDRVEELVQSDFQDIWPRFENRTDIQGRFLVPGKDWQEPPQELAVWRDDRLQWIP